MGYAFRTNTRKYKTYTGKTFSISLSSNGSDPDTVVVKVFNTKKPKAEVAVYVGSFSESQGVGFSTGKTLAITDPEAVALCRGVLADDTGIAPLIDKLTDLNPTGYTATRAMTNLARWWVLAQQENPTAFVTAERKQKAYDDKRFAIGDRVVYHSRHGGNSMEGVITAEAFDWADWSGGGWRFQIPGVNAPQLQLRKIEEPAEVA